MALPEEAQTGKPLASAARLPDALGHSGLKVPMPRAQWGLSTFLQVVAIVFSFHAQSTSALTREGDYLLLEANDRLALSGPSNIKDVVVMGKAQLTLDNVTDSTPDVTVREEGKVLIRNSSVGLVYLYESGALVLENANSNSHITARDQSSITLRNTTVDGIIEASEGATVELNGVIANLLHLKGNNQAYISDFITRKGNPKSGDAFSGGQIIYSPRAQIHLYADEVSFVDGTLTGYGNSAERFSYLLLEDSEAIEVAQAVPTQLILHAAPGPSFPCGKAASRAERTVCANKELALMDKQLARAYRQAISDPSALGGIQKAQRRWVSGMRDRCTDTPCLRAAYQARIRALGKTKWMTNVKEKAICDTVVRAINDGTIENRFVQFRAATDAEQERWNNSFGGKDSTYLWQVLNTRFGNKPRKLGLFGGGGSCSSCTIADLEAKTPTLYPTEDPGERLRWANWGFCDHLLFVEGEPVVVSGRFGSGESEATLVSWMAPDGARRALCHLARSGLPMKTQVVREENPELCRAVSAGEVKSLPWTNWPAPLSVVDEAEVRADTQRRADFDLDMDGETEAITLFEHASGLGCGSYSQYLMLLTDDGTAVADSPLNAYFDPDSPWGPIKGVASNDVDNPAFAVKLFTYGEKPYVLRRGKRTSAEVVSFWKGNAQTWCEYQNLPQYKVEVFYPVETWPTSAPSQEAQSHTAKAVK